MNQKQTETSKEKSWSLTLKAPPCIDKIYKSEKISKTGFYLPIIPDYSKIFFTDICPS